MSLNPKTSVAAFLNYPTFLWGGKEVIIVDPEESPDSGCRFPVNGAPTLVTLCQISPKHFLVLCPYGGIHEALETALECYEELFGKLTVADPPFETEEGYLPINGGAEWLPNDDWSVQDEGLEELLKAAHTACHQWQHIKVSVCYEIVTPASRDDADFYACGEHSVEECNGLQEVYDALCEESADASSWPSWHPGTWYSGTKAHPSDDVPDGTVQYTFHLDKDLPEAWQRRLYDVTA